MAHAGHALVGDPVYGGKRKLPQNALPEAGFAAATDFARQALHARELGFAHPVSGRDMLFEAPLPNDMSAMVQALRP
jgi:23S rRNA pseudouridine1911/1915/1917 synthase